MDPNEITALITTVGFPIVMCLIMWKALQDSTQAHKQETDGLKEALNQNTVVIAELKTIMKDIAEAVKPHE